MGEDQSGTIRDLCLHGDHGGQALSDECLSDTGEAIMARAASALAGVEDGELQELCVMQQRRELTSVDPTPTWPGRRPIPPSTQRSRR